MKTINHQRPSPHIQGCDPGAILAERGCGGDPLQQVQNGSRLNFLNAPGKAKLLRLVGTTQPRSKSWFMERIAEGGMGS
jgi:hypothetical protein